MKEDFRAIGNSSPRSSHGEDAASKIRTRNIFTDEEDEAIRRLVQKSDVSDLKQIAILPLTLSMARGLKTCGRHLHASQQLVAIDINKCRFCKDGI
jgi:hypothetical protein